MSNQIFAVSVNSFKDFKFVKLEVFSKLFNEIKPMAIGRIIMPSFSISPKHYCHTLELIYKEVEQDILVTEESEFNKKPSTTRPISKVIAELQANKENMPVPRKLDFEVVSNFEVTTPLSSNHIFLYFDQ